MSNNRVEFKDLQKIRGRTVGVEIECAAPYSFESFQSLFRRYISMFGGDPSVWIVETDPSIHPHQDRYNVITTPGYRAGEQMSLFATDTNIERQSIENSLERVVSKIEVKTIPLAFNKLSIKTILTGLRVLKRMGVEFNETTGLHVHVSFPEISSFELLFMLFKLVDLEESKILSKLYPDRKGNTNALPALDVITEIYDIFKNVDDATLASTSFLQIDELAHRINTRYYGLNSKAYTKHSTYEFRYASASADESKLVRWLYTIGNLINDSIRAKKCSFKNESIQLDVYRGSNWKTPIVVIDGKKIKGFPEVYETDVNDINVELMLEQIDVPYMRATNKDFVKIVIETSKKLRLNSHIERFASAIDTFKEIVERNRLVLLTFSSLFEADAYSFNSSYFAKLYLDDMINLITELKLIGYRSDTFDDFVNAMDKMATGYRNGKLYDDCYEHIHNVNIPIYATAEHSLKFAIGIAILSNAKLDNVSDNDFHKIGKSLAEYYPTIRHEEESFSSNCADIMIDLAKEHTSDSIRQKLITLYIEIFKRSIKKCAGRLLSIDMSTKMIDILYDNSNHEDFINIVEYLMTDLYVKQIPANRIADYLEVIKYACSKHNDLKHIMLFFSDRSDLTIEEIGEIIDTKIIKSSLVNLLPKTYVLALYRTVNMFFDFGIVENKKTFELIVKTHTELIGYQFHKLYNDTLHPIENNIDENVSYVLYTLFVNGYLYGTSLIEYIEEYAEANNLIEKICVRLSLYKITRVIQFGNKEDEFVEFFKKYKIEERIVNDKNLSKIAYDVYEKHFLNFVNTGNLSDRHHAVYELFFKKLYDNKYLNSNDDLLKVMRFENLFNDSNLKLPLLVTSKRELNDADMDRYSSFLDKLYDFKVVNEKFFYLRINLLKYGTLINAKTLPAMVNIFDDIEAIAHSSTDYNLIKTYYNYYCRINGEESNLLFLNSESQYLSLLKNKYSGIFKNCTIEYEADIDDFSFACRVLIDGTEHSFTIKIESIISYITDNKKHLLSKVLSDGAAEEPHTVAIKVLLPEIFKMMTAEDFKIAGKKVLVNKGKVIKEMLLTKSERSLLERAIGSGRKNKRSIHL